MLNAFLLTLIKFVLYLYADQGYGYNGGYGSGGGRNVNTRGKGTCGDVLDFNFLCFSKFENVTCFSFIFLKN